MWIPAAIQGIGFLGKLFGFGQEEPEEPGMSGQYRQSQFLPERGSPLPQYDPRQRQPRSDSPLMSYLMKFMR